MSTKRKTISFLLFFAFSLIYGLVLIRAIKGLGVYWDWSFPYFSEDMPRFFSKAYMSWSDYSLGFPLQLPSDYYLRLIISLVRLPPEIIIYFYNTLLFSLLSFVCFNYFNRTASYVKSFLLSLVMILNPVVFYSVLAGYYLQNTSYVLFVFLLIYLIRHYQTKMKDAIIVGLILAFIGFQLQFYVFGLLIYFIFLAFYFKKVKIYQVAVTVSISLLVNLFWLFNYFSASNFIVTLQQLKKTSVFSLSTILSLFQLNFPGSTLLNLVYSPHFYIYSMFLTVFLVMHLLSKRLNKVNVFLLSSLVIFLILGTGIFHNFQIWPISIFYPALRDIGHFSPVIFGLLILTVGTIKLTNKYVNFSFSVYLLVFIIINLCYFSTSLPYFDYSFLRSKFIPYKTILKQDQAIYRVVDYPFWQNYNYFDVPTKITSGGFPLNNNGKNNFMDYSGHDLIQPTNPAHLENDSFFNFLKSKDLNLLKKYNVRYIFDFSKIYQSQSEYFWLNEWYFGNLKNIKNDSKFLEEVINVNPGKTKRITDYIIEISDYLPRVVINNGHFEEKNPTEIKIFISNISKIENLDFLESFHSEWKLYLQKNPDKSWCKDLKYFDQVKTTECEHKGSFFEGEELSSLWKKPIFDNTHKKVFDYANEWEISADYIKKNFSKEYYKQNSDGSIDIELTLYFKPQSYFYLGLIVSGTTLFLCVGYLLYTLVWKKFKSRRSN